MMRAQANLLLMPLVVATEGWNEATIALYVDKLMRLANERMLAQAIDDVIRTWTKTSRPPVGVVMQAYNALASHAPALPRGEEEQACPPARGLQIMWENYEAECRRLGKEPDTAYYDRWQRAIGAS